jgi:hypothetical protein
MKAYGGVEVQLHHSSPRQQMEVSTHIHTPAAPGETAPDKGQGGPQSRCGRYGKESNLGRPARSPLLNRLSYLDSCTVAGQLQSER